MMEAMSSRERVLATLDFAGPDRLPTDLWPLPSAWFGRAAAVNAILAKYPRDFGGAGVENIFDTAYYESVGYQPLSYSVLGYPMPGRTYTVGMQVDL